MSLMTAEHLTDPNFTPVICKGKHESFAKYFVVHVIVFCVYFCTDLACQSWYTFAEAGAMTVFGQRIKLRDALHLESRWSGFCKNSKQITNGNNISWWLSSQN